MNTDSMDDPGVSGEHRLGVGDLRRTGLRTGDDVHVLQRRLEMSGWLDRDEVEALFDIDAATRAPSDGWRTWFVETVTDHVVWTCRPTGMVDGEQAEWLLDCADRTRSDSSLAVLVAVIDAAHRVPAWFTAAVRSRAARFGFDVDPRPSEGRFVAHLAA